MVEQDPLWRVGLHGLAQGAVGGFLVSLLALWLYNNDLWPLNTVLSWQSVIGYTALFGWIGGFGAVLTERKRRNAVLEPASGSTGLAATDETP
ncbi:hypothetical protein [Streptosporangium sp. NBC_01756]|uniref:hypothetical protein n=1 Tax=Streptosporangium sp. NBC_01756 TaxID=2975950 RepID=UPI002DD80632|nr:hypothetical protein [Streptosporangium sp. NBC_01756]WSC89915.1 hypothetical protein OIE48_17555 [Streptosporangium sp. NBC_01756]